MSLVWFLLFCACVVGLASAIPKLRYNIDEADLHFEQFINKHNKQYADEHEKQSRFQIFKDNLVKVNQLNERFNSSTHGITRFMDLTIEEFRKMHTGLKAAASECTVLTDADIPDAGAPDNFDWRDNNGVTPIRNQDNCGSCYAFSAVGNIESQYLIKNKVALDLAEQQVVDCDSRNNGCFGGTMANVFRSFIEIGGVESEADYPYIGQHINNCEFDANKVKVKLSSCNSYKLTSQEKLKQLLYHYGPISIGIKADGIRFARHEDVIITDEECDEGDIDHGVLLVGYGEKDGTPYWIIKNSWGTDWGHEGYFKVVRGENAHSCAMLNHFMATAVLA